MSAKSLKTKLAIVSAVLGTAALVSFLKDVGDELDWYDSRILNNAADIEALRAQING